MKNEIKTTAVFLLLGIVIAGGFLGYTLLKHWKTYVSQEFAFEIRYPQDWDVLVKEEVNKEFGVKKRFALFSDELSLDIFVISNEQLQELFSGLLETKVGEVFKRDDVAYSVQEHLVISGLPGIVYHADRSALSATFPSILGEAMLKKDNTIFQFAFIGSKEAAEKKSGIFKQMLSTFRFTP